MAIIGGIDNASRAGKNDDMALYHLIFTEDSLIAARVMKRKEEFKKEENQLKYNPNGVVTWSSNTLTKELHIKLYNEALELGKSIEENLDEFIASNPDAVETIKYSTITRVEFSKGTMFARPHIRLIQSNIETKYHLLRDIFEKAGKLDDDVFVSYRNILKKAFGVKLRIRV